MLDTETVNHPLSGLLLLSMSMYMYIFSDINECIGSNTCDMRLGVGGCMNTMGSYTCTCTDGYIINYNNDCIGKHKHL